MAAKNKAAFLYGIEVTTANQNIDFKTSALGPIIMTQLPLGYYSLTALGNAFKAALAAADPVNLYTITIDRSVNDNTENRITIETTGTYLDLLFGSGPRSGTSIAPVIGFNGTDRTGDTIYTGDFTSGTPLITEFAGYNYIPTTMHQKVEGAVSVSASGEKEAIVFTVQEFLEVEFKYEPEAKVITEWQSFFVWAIKQRAFDFTPDISLPNDIVEVTLESTSADGKGLGFKFKEMLPSFPFNYTTGNMKFRKRLFSGLF